MLWESRVVLGRGIERESARALGNVHADRYLPRLRAQLLLLLRLVKRMLLLLLRLGLAKRMLLLGRDLLLDRHLLLG